MDDTPEEKREATNALEALKRVERPTVAQRINDGLAKVPGLNSLLDLKVKQLNRERRNLYHNLEIPAEELDSKTGFPKATYASNKIRTTKYTPLKFLPKNIFFQFQIPANIFFLSIAVLSSWKVFGVDNPGLSAVPIIAIVAITAIRDGIEDYRRYLLDGELNNGVTSILHGVDNPNVIAENVSLWRRFKKVSSRNLSRFGRSVTFRKQKNLNAIENATLHSETTAPALRPSTTTNRFSLSTFRHSLDASRTLEQPQGKVKFRRDYWKDVRVGQFIKVFANEAVPADIVVISSSDEDGECFIETRNLDGETNLKPRSAVKCTSHLKRGKQIRDARFWMEIENANSNLSSFGWAIHVDGREEPLSAANLIPRGSTLRNTKHVIGYVVYTGVESKIMLNAGETPTKRSRLTRQLSFYTLVSFIILFILSFAAGLTNGLKFRSHHNSATFFEFGLNAGNPPVNGFVTFWASMIVLQNLIPISLFISVEIVRTIQAYFIFSDMLMYDEALDYPCTPKTWSISDDLGQIEFIFSDKTGTLTQNSMVFRKCIINDKSYGIAWTEAMAGDYKRKNGDAAAEDKGHLMDRLIGEKRQKMADMLVKNYDNPYYDVDDPNDELAFVSPEFAEDIMGAAGPTQQQAIDMYLRALALCNTAVTEFEDGKLIHQAQSPDEACLVKFCRQVGCMLTEAKKGLMSVNIRGVEETYEVLQMIFFSSQRKRMSILVKNPEGRCFVFTKGADGVVARGLSSPPSSTTTGAINDFADEGLRTMMVAYREVTVKYAEDWVQRYAVAQASTNRDVEMERLANELESGLTLLGGTAIEDLLQVGVPDTIQMLLQAGIKLWVLTGDKIGTAISIAFSSNLLQTNMKLMILERAEQLQEYLQEFDLELTPDTLKAAIADHSPAPPDHALVVDGAALDEIVTSIEYCQQFALLGKKCRSVLCCRVSPAQKAAVVNIVKNVLDVTTMAVGDGANDISMIQEADVGVGIVGVEGRQAAMSSDYAIGQFRFLQRLVLVHGRWSYMRTADMSINLLYKNYVFSLVLFWYQIWTNMDQSYLFDYTYITLFNSVFTSLPVVCMGCFDQDVPDYVCLAEPHLYAKGILRQAFTKTKNFIFALDGTYQSIICYFFAYALFHSGSFASMSGRQVNYKEAVGAYAATTTILACNAFVMMNQYRWDWLSIIVNVISSAAVFAWTGIYTVFTASNVFYKTAPHVYGTLTFWAVLLVGLVACLIPRFLYMAVKHVFHPDDVDIVRERLAQGGYEDIKHKYRDTIPTKNSEDESRMLSRQPSVISDPSAISERL
ncbi:Phospholipid-transporting ATPase DNF2 [Wickerhamiella sorbophila]|uniref:Phospholipid-transporting ATPase n=1 Tax=Wickerhamiella sorbophila TaxID=45607 RepID=A0A2T0FDR3_9ASCO|nr:Phospholipid-transporting ATPase DNF2 [Wickerhamiella sorbophila]PRT53146.1 Phospholipid-transporting ATPase DNF2 [Wickerhamiella sorbophila]